MEAQCGYCRHYERGLPGMAGDCRYPVEWPVLPEAYRQLNGDMPKKPSKSPMEENEGEGCPVFEER